MRAKTGMNRQIRDISLHEWELLRPAHMWLRYDSPNFGEVLSRQPRLGLSMVVWIDTTRQIVPKIGGMVNGLPSQVPAPDSLRAHVDKVYMLCPDTRNLIPSFLEVVCNSTSSQEEVYIP